MAPLTKIDVSHILVKSKFEAEDIQKKLASGSTFSRLAQQFSLCSSASGGGHLGLVPLKKLDSDFAEAALATNVGEISQPIRTRFGYHLILRHA